MVDILERKIWLGVNREVNPP